MTDKDIIKALKICTSSSNGCSHSKYTCDDCYLKSQPMCSAVLHQDTIDLINRQQAELESIRLSLGLINKRKYYRKFVDEVFRKQKGKELSTPDFDYIYELYFKQQAEIERLKAEDEKYPFKCVMPFNSMVYSKSIEDYDRLIGDIGADAIKEFAERLKPKLSVYDEVYVDSLVKEMVGEE